MKIITSSKLKQIILERLFSEGQAEDLLVKFPELQPAYDAGIRNAQYLQWIQKRKGGEPVEDIVGVVQAFDDAKQRFKAKGMSPDIYAYKTPALLRQALEDLGGSKGAESRRLKDEEVTYLGEFGNWVVAMPHTRESSCQLGKGTTWCTAATQSQNLFLSYVAAPNRNVILYYIIKKGADSRKDSTAKLSVGFVNGEPKLSARGVSVDANNVGLDERKLKRILGSNFQPIMDAMIEHATKIGGKHPAKDHMKKIAKSKDPSVIDKYTSGMETEERKEFLEKILELKPSAEILSRLASEDERAYGQVRKLVAGNPSTPKQILIKFSDDDDEYIRRNVAENPSAPTEVLTKLSSDKKRYVREGVAENPSTPPEALIRLSYDESVRQGLPSGVITPFNGVKQGVANNPSTPPEALIRLSYDESPQVKEFVASNPRTPLEVLIRLLSDRSFNVPWVRRAVRDNKTYKDYINQKDQQLQESWMKIAGISKQNNNGEY
mgnify:CR=1 FL=1